MNEEESVCLPNGKVISRAKWREDQRKHKERIESRQRWVVNPETGVEEKHEDFSNRTPYDPSTDRLEINRRTRRLRRDRIKNPSPLDLMEEESGRGSSTDLHPQNRKKLREKWVTGEDKLGFTAPAPISNTFKIGPKPASPRSTVKSQATVTDAVDKIAAQRQSVSSSVESFLKRSNIQTSHLVIGGAMLAGVWLLAQGHRHHRGEPPPVDQLVKHYSHGGPLSALAAGGMMRLVGMSTHNPAAMAVAAGAGAAVGSFIGDRHYAKHGSMGLVAVTAGLTGAAAVVARAGANRWVDPGINTLRSFLKSHAASVDEGLATVMSKTKGLHPLLDSMLSRAGLKGLLTVAAIPVAHAMVQRVITRKYRQADTFLHASILGPLTPHPVDLPRTDGAKYLPGSKVEGGTLTMDGDVYDHTDRVDLHRL